MSPRENILVLKLDEFIRRYYKNQLIKGSLYSAALLIGTFLLVTLLEYFGHFGQIVRGFLFLGFVFTAVFILGKFVFIPLLKLYRIGTVITYEQAATIIGAHFSNVQDKLLNVLELRKGRAMYQSDELLMAGIQQKIEELTPVPFATAIDLKQNRRYLKYLLPLIVLTLVIATVWPYFFTKGATRLVNFSTYYEKEMPFSFEIVNKKLSALQSEDFTLDLRLHGRSVPFEVFVEVGGIEYPLEKRGADQFQYTFSNLQSNVKFRLNGAGYYSREYEIEVLPRPGLLQFNVQLVYPSYLHRTNETVQNNGDLQVPEGTRVNWTFNTRNADELQVLFSDTVLSPSQNGKDQFFFSRRVFRNEKYTLKPVNRFVKSGADSVSYNISVIPDRAPSIDLSEKHDSLQPRQLYLSGQIKDDYGFTGLSFHLTRTYTDSSGKLQTQKESQPLSFDPAKVSQPYFHFLDMTRFGLAPGEKVEYYFEVFDNDGIRGPKAARTRVMTYRAPTREQIQESVEKSGEEIKKDLESSIKKAAQLQKEISDLSRKINEKQQLGYDDKKSLQDLLRKQQELQQKIEDLKQQQEQISQQRNELNPMDESLLEKQRQLQELFENVMTPEMKKLFDELNKMLERLDKNQVQEKLEELKLTNKDIEKELDRNLEAFRQLELQQKMQDAITKLEELQKQQEKLQRQTEGKEKPAIEKQNSKDQQKTDSEQDKNDKSDKENTDQEKGKNDQDQAKESPLSKDELKRKQEELNKEFEELRRDLQEAREKNKQLEEPLSLPETEKSESEISEQMQQSSQKLDQGNKKGASQNQKNASEKMQQMKEAMQEAMAEAESRQDEENAQALRQILENLLNLSFSQEDLMKDLRKTRIDNPKYVEIPKAQNRLRDNSKIIEDSLLALGKRAPQISAIVNREISSINLNMDKTVKHLAERNTGESLMRMQSTMKSVNDLALMLNESLEQMQKQMQQKKNGKGAQGGACKKPGEGSGRSPTNTGKPIANMRQMQEQLNRQLQELKEALEKGQKPGDKPGDKGKKPGSMQGGSMLPGTRGNSEQFARMAAQQEALRRQLEQLMNNMKNKGKNPGGNLSELMEQTEKDLVNRRLSNETMKRQQEILTRLLESEKAERERELDEQRKSTESKSEITGNPERFLEYKRLKEKEMELLHTVPPSLTPFYKEKVNQYFNQLNGK